MPAEITDVDVAEARRRIERGARLFDVREQGSGTRSTHPRRGSCRCPMIVARWKEIDAATSRRSSSATRVHGLPASSRHSSSPASPPSTSPAAWWRGEQSGAPVVRPSDGRTTPRANRVTSTDRTRVVLSDRVRTESREARRDGHRESTPQDAARDGAAATRSSSAGAREDASRPGSAPRPSSPLGRNHRQPRFSARCCRGSSHVRSRRRGRHPDPHRPLAPPEGRRHAHRACVLGRRTGARRAEAEVRRGRTSPTRSPSRRSSPTSASARSPSRPRCCTTPVEDTDYQLDQLRADFGDEIAMLVDGVTKLDKVKYGDSAQGRGRPQDGHRDVEGHPACS